MKTKHTLADIEAFKLLLRAETPQRIIEFKSPTEAGNIILALALKIKKQRKENE